MPTQTRRFRWALALLPALALFLVVHLANHPLFSFAAGRRTPDALLAAARERCAAVSDFTCDFVRQENLDGKLSKRQTIHVLFREEPYSVYMEWRGGIGRIRRALYVEGRYRDNDGNELVLVEPAGGVARLLAGTVKVPLHGDEARKSSRRSLDQFGFYQALEIILRENERFAAEGTLTWDPVTNGQVGDRDTYVLVRHLPYEGPAGPYPNRRLVIHIDRESLLPLAFRAYADEAEQELLEDYTFSAICLNPGLGDEHFAF